MSPLPADFETWDRDRLLAYWKKSFGQHPPARMRIEFLRRAVAWQVQAGPMAKPAGDRGRRRHRSIPLAPGTLLIREWQGESHRVLVTSAGFEYRGTPYRSLSRIARTITGTNWSGPAFFGTAS